MLSIFQKIKKGFKSEEANQHIPEAESHFADKVSLNAYNRAAVSFEPLPKPKSYYDRLDSPLVSDIPQDKLQEALEKDRYPLPATADREGYHDDRHLEYWISGLQDCLAAQECMRKWLSNTGPNLQLLDLGCASGRVLRHFAWLMEGAAVWGADLNGRHVEWIRQHLPQHIKIFQNFTTPLLPLESNSFNFISAFSVFTHIDEFELNWLAELRRIIAPRGIAYITIHTENTWQGIHPDNPDHGYYRPLAKSILELQDYLQGLQFSEDIFKKRPPYPKIVFRWPTSNNVYNTLVFHTMDYIRNTWGRFFSILETQIRGSGYQDVVVLQKPGSPA